ncbi:MAG TPA: YraN family protein [Burkholderiales bacterium]|nr:YraN family protein [Burkholderiales bacterium]
MNPQQRGSEAEAQALAFLQRHGLVLIQRNYRCRFGEIDLIMRDGDTLVFTEVRQRTRADFGGAAASITARKRERLAATARHYLGRTGSMPACRFDALLIDGGGLRWIRDAFYAF